MRRSSQFPRGRKALSLLEVVLALAIFLFSLVGIGQLVNLGTERGEDVRLQLQAIQLCQTKLAELDVGVIPLVPQTNVAYLDDPNWHWSVACRRNLLGGLWDAHVTIARLDAKGVRTEWSLSQMVLDPALRGERSGLAGESNQNDSSRPGAISSDTTGSHSQAAPASSGPPTSSAPNGGK